MNLSIIVVILGWVVMLEGVFFVPTALVGFCYGEMREGLVYLVLGLICMAAGQLLRTRKAKSTTFYAREGFVAVALSWIVLSLIGSLPFVITGDIAAYHDALFEIISGFTTTGSTILTDVEALAHCNLFWRSFSHWIGGMGVLVFILAILPMSGGSTMNLMKAESPGPSVGKLVPRIQETAFILYAIYFAMTVIEMVLLLLGGMPLFEAVCHSFGTAGTGGFGVLGDSIASYSTYIQVVITIFMLLFGTNFTFYYLILMGKPGEARGMTEVKWYLRIYAVVVGLITLNLVLTGTPFLETLQQVAFQVASVMTTTGYATTNFDLWPNFSRAMMVCVMFIGACAGSTGGGMKVSRIMLYVSQVKNELRQQIHPRSVEVVRMDGKAVDHDVIRSANIFLMAYIMIFVGSFLILCLDQFDLVTNFTAVTATLNNIGPGLNVIGPEGTFTGFSLLSKFVLMFDMLAGRLEIIPMLVLFHPQTWKK